MSTAVCKYHPRVPAQWFCGTCNIHLCPSCIKTEYLPDLVHTCPVCKNYATALGMANIITPFWKRLPHFFLYPVNLSSLGVIASIMILSALTFRASLVGALLQLVLFVMFLRYAYAVLLHTALGHRTPPPLSHATLIEGMELPFKQVFVFVAMGLIAGLAEDLAGGLAGAMLSWLFLLAVPATVMVIAIDHSFFRALNPLVLAGIVRHIGWSYLLLYFFLLLLWGGSTTAVSVLYGRVPTLIFVAMYAFASMYFMLIMFNMMGYVIYQYHEELGFSPEVDVGGAAASVAAGATLDPAANEVNILVTEGKVPEAIALLQERVRKSPGDHDLHERLHKLLKLANRGEDMARHGRDWLGQLIGDKRHKKAVDVVRDCIPADPEFRPNDPAQIYPLASFARDTHENKIAIHLLNGFMRRHAGHPDIPRVCLLAAKLLCETLKQDAQAQKILEELLRRYPQHELVPEIRKYLGIIGKLAAQPGAR